MGQKDGLYLCNSTQKRSAVAYYSNFSHDDGNNGQQPDALVYVSNGADFIWEGNQQAVKFNSGVTFTWSINSDGFSQPLGTVVGLASNQFENFNVFKGNGTKLVTDNDGVDLFIIYTVN